MTDMPWELKTPDLVANLRLYETSSRGDVCTKFPDYRVAFFTEKDIAVGGWTAALQLQDKPFEPGSERRVGLVFVSKEGAELMRHARRFYFAEGSNFVGEGTLVE